MRLTAHPDIDTLAAETIAWEESPCLLCGSAQRAPLFEAADPLGAGLRFLLVKCESCGLCYTNPRPDAASIQRFYPPDYPCHHAKERARNADPIGTVLPIQGQGRLLDFGCGAGDFLRRMHALGWNVTGLDLAEAAVTCARADGLTVYLGTLPHPLWSGPSFEAITMWQSLEHVHQPLDVLHAAYRLLTDAGRLIVAVPNFDSLASRWFGANWYGLDVPRHLTHFTPDTLRAMLARAGFARIDVRQQQRNSWIRHSAERAGGGIWATRLGSGLAGSWGRWTGQADCLIALASKS